MRNVDEGIIQKIIIPETNPAPNPEPSPRPKKRIVDCKCDAQLLNEIQLKVRKSTALTCLKRTQFIRTLQVNGIHNKREYSNYTNSHIDNNFPTDPFTKFRDFKWEETYVDIAPYYTKSEYITRLQRFEGNDMEIDALREDHEELLEYLCKKDTKIPDSYPWYYYGGDNPNEWVIFD